MKMKFLVHMLIILAIIKLVISSEGEVKTTDKWKNAKCSCNEVNRKNIKEIMCLCNGTMCKCGNDTTKIMDIMCNCGDNTMCECKNNNIACQCDISFTIDQSEVRKLANNEQNYTEKKCIEEDYCFDSLNSQCLQNSKISSLKSWDDIEKIITTNNDLVNVNQINCGTTLEDCFKISPTKGIAGDCTSTENNDNLKEYEAHCCYMTVTYKHNKRYSCYPIKKDKNTIKNKIKELKSKYDGSKKISIDCYSSFLKNAFTGLLIMILFI